MEQAVFECENHSDLYDLPAYFFARMAIGIAIYLAMPVLQYFLWHVPISHLAYIQALIISL
jgi:hypothetical protein